MITIITEKPSVAREIARLLGASKKENGYLSGNDYFVTWAFGHLLTLGMPEDYGLIGFKREQLPIFPDPFMLTIRKVKKGKSFVTDEGASKQLKVIETLLKRSTSIIVATDAGREGELIFRYIYQYLNCGLPFERLWISSLTEKAIKVGFANLKNGNEFDGLHKAGESRSRADWIVGINASQALSIASGEGIYSLGRVQTPTFAIVCKRYLAHKGFDSKLYWQIELTHKKEFVEFKSLSVQRWDDKALAENTVKALGKQNNASVTKVSIKTITEAAPLLFDITGLQKECNKQFGLSAEETLSIAQSLYEKKFITYPRTGSKHITEDLWSEIPKLIRALPDKESLKDAAQKIKWGRFNRSIVNDLRVTDHHGLLTTEVVPTAIYGKESAVYDMIALRLMEAISHVCNKEVSDIIIEVSGTEFAVKGTVIKEAGWRAIRGSFEKDGEDPLIHLPELREGDDIRILERNLLEKKTKPPKLYTEASLLSAMESAGKEIDDLEERKAIQQIGIGTAATRAAIIETLLKRDYIRRKKKLLIPTEKGLQVYEIIKDRKIADVAMTAQWELAFSQIESGELDEKVFQEQIKEYTSTITSDLLNISIQTETLPDLTCPKCGVSQLHIKEKIAKCSDEKCAWLQYRVVCGVKLSIEDITLLVESGRTNLLKGLATKSGKRFNAYIIRNENGDTSFEFEKNLRKQ